MHTLPRIVFEEKEDEGKREARRQIAPSVPRQDRTANIFASNIDFDQKENRFMKHREVLFHLFGVCHLEIQSNHRDPKYRAVVDRWSLLRGSFML